MNIIVAFKVVPDDQDIRFSEDGSLDYSKAKGVVSAYDLNAIEAAVRLAADHEGSKVVAVTIGPAAIDDPKLKKNVLSRGVDELMVAADNGHAHLDAHATAAVLTSALEQIEPYDLILCGDGSADDYAQQVDVHLASALGLPCVSGVVSIDAQDHVLHVERATENAIEVIEVGLPAVVAVTPDAASPRIPGMRDILAAGKKPVHKAGEGVVAKRSLEEVSCKAPKMSARRQDTSDASLDGAIDRFAAALKASL